MNRKISRVAIVAFVFGCMGLFFSQIHATGPKILAIPIGPVAIVFAIVALWVIRRNSGTLRGRKLAVWGGVLGLAGMIMSFASVSRMFAQNFDQDQWRQQQADQLQRMVRRRSTPRESAKEFTSNLPLIVLRGNPQSGSKQRDALLRADFFDVDESKRAAVNRPPSHSGLVSMHPRGNTSMQLPKRSYSMHTLDNQTNQVKVPLFGLAKDDDWILYASFEDKTLIRDVLAYELSNEMGQYAPRTRYVELFVQNSAGPLSMRDYEGVYVLVEKIKRSDDRVKIAKLTPENKTEPDISGGYIVKRDHQEDSGKRFRTPRGGPFFHVYPKEDVITREQRAWIANYFRAFEEALYGNDFADPKTGYAAYLDTAAFIDMHWLIEFSKNVDGFRYSAFLTKDRNSKLKTGPAWDWNRAFGNANYYGGWQTSGWYWRVLRPNEISWYARLRQDPAFEARCKARWRELRKGAFNPETLTRKIDAHAALLAEAQKRNFERWTIMGQQVTCNHFVGNSYEEEVAWLKKWVERRIAWIDKQIATGAPVRDEDEEPGQDFRFNR